MSSGVGPVRFILFHTMYKFMIRIKIILQHVSMHV